MERFGANFKKKLSLTKDKIANLTINGVNSIEDSVKISSGYNTTRTNNPASEYWKNIGEKTFNRSEMPKNSPKPEGKPSTLTCNLQMNTNQAHQGRKYLYAVGGLNSTAGMMIERLDLQSFHFNAIGMTSSPVKWEMVDNRNETRSKFGCIKLGDEEIMIFGGKVGADRVSNSKVYNLKTNTWSEGKFSLSEGKSGFGYCVCNNKLYIAGGNNGTDILSSLESYDLETGNKTILNNMSQPRDETQLVQIQNHIYAIGGGG